MSAVFADTSGLLALLNAEDENHAGRRAFRAFRPSGAIGIDLIRPRGNLCIDRPAPRLEAVRSFRADLAPLIDVLWVDEAIHNAGLDFCSIAKTASEPCRRGVVHHDAPEEPGRGLRVPSPL